MSMRLSPRGFLVTGGAVLTVLGLIGFVTLKDPALSFFWLDMGATIAHLALGLVALAAVYVPGLNDALRPYYRSIVIVYGLIALFFGVYGVILPAGSPAALNTFGLANLELGDSLLYLTFAVWAFAAALMASSREQRR